MTLCDWYKFEENVSELIKKIERNEKSSRSFNFASLVNSLPMQRKIAEMWIKDQYPPNYSLGDIAKRPKSEKIRIGYFSADFQCHPVSLLTAELFECHDKNQFEIIAFSFGYNTKDPVRQRLEKAFDKFVNVLGQSDQAVAHLAREMKIDIAIDLGGATKGGRPGVFSYRAAPIQVNYLGYPGTMGADYFDYLIADKTIIPEESQQYFVEKIVYLPNSYQPNDSKRVISERQFSKQQLGLPNEGFVFCCFNNNYKITPRVFDGWMRILKAVEGSVLFLYADNKTVEKNLRKEAEIRCVDPNRLIFGESLAYGDYLARYKIADLFLNTFPYNAGATASDALWMGLPLLTFSGETFSSRVAASLLMAIELPELITHTQEHYESLAIELATHPTKLNAIKAKLAANKLTTPLFDTPLFTKNIEKAYIKMVERYQSDLTPDHIYIE
jgi:protein O-GlcNAc transferase